MIQTAQVFIDLTEKNLGALSGAPVTHSKRYLKDVAAHFANKKAAAAMEQDTLLYEVSAWLPVPEGKVGGLFYGLSCVHPGTVGGEFFMTKGHFHAERDTAEFYWGLGGSGFLLFMDEQRKYWVETVEKGSLHYVQGNVAHRLINTGTELLKVAACWPSNAGHDYDSITKQGFSVRVFAAPNSQGVELQELA